MYPCDIKRISKFKQIASLNADIISVTFPSMETNETRIERAFYDSGKIFQEIPFIGGHKTGTFREYHENGVLALESPMINGMRHGICRQWDEKGKLLGSYEMDMGTGISKCWHSNGRLKFEAHLINEIFNGRVRLWLESGKLKEETFQIGNRRVSKEEYEKACASNPALPAYQDN
jgi:antitoxin component YwqK of YwqJK toxin-antitoxin module